MPNDDLISRKALLEKVFTKQGDFHYFREPPEKVVRATDVINAPAVEAEPVRCGSWGECRITGYDGLHAVYTRPCSECGHEARFSTNYCPNCGAKMENPT